MNNRLPVIFIHEGNQKYLKIAIESAEKYNKEVYLIGDNQNKEYGKKHFFIDEFNYKLYEEFSKYYIHMSTNSEKFERNCFKRYFTLKEFMEKNNINSILMLDSDVISYMDFSKVDYGTNIAALSIPKKQECFRYTASPHCSYWTLEAINKFIDFCIDTYKNNIDILKEKYNYHIAHNLKGGVCDMTLLYLWASKTENIMNNLENHNGKVFDLNINANENYLKNEFVYSKIFRMKKIKAKNNILYLIKDGKEEPVGCLHFQGRAKEMMQDVYSLKLRKAYLTRLKTYCKYILRKK